MNIKGKYNNPNLSKNSHENVILSQSLNPPLHVLVICSQFSSTLFMQITNIDNNMTYYLTFIGECHRYALLQRKM